MLKRGSNIMRDVGDESVESVESDERCDFEHI